MVTIEDGGEVISRRYNTLDTGLCRIILVMSTFNSTTTTTTARTKDNMPTLWELVGLSFFFFFLSFFRVNKKYRTC
jgi:hypothetical protein